MSMKNPSAAESFSQSVVDASMIASRHLLVAFTASLALVVGGTFAQGPVSDEQSTGEKPARFADRDSTRDLRPIVEMGDEPVRLDSVGLVVYPPMRSRAQTTSVGGVSTIEIIPDDASWLMSIKTPRTADKTHTSAYVADSALIDLIAANGLVFDAAQGMSAEQIKEMWQANKFEAVDGFKGFKGLVQERNRAVKLPGFPEPVEQFFVSLPSQPSQPAVIRGVTVAKVDDDRFVIFELMTTEANFARAKDVYAVVLGGARIGDPKEVAQDRAEAVTAGVKLFEKLSASDLESIVGSMGERWERRSKPGSTGDTADDTELGYRWVRVWKGRRGELDPSTPTGRYSDLDRQEGFLVKMEARIIERGRIIDSRSVFFVTPDRQEEAWSITMGVQDLKQSDKIAYSEIGVRREKDLTVTTSGAGNPGVQSKPLIEGPGYISRVEAFLLPQIMIRAGLAGEYGFYAFQSDSGNIKLRRDSLSQPPGSLDAWVIETRLSEDAKTQTSTFKPDGSLISSRLPDGSIWEPVEKDRLIRLWRSKGMPMN
jgi:hypothetical protein